MASHSSTMETDEDLFDETEDEGPWEIVEQETPDERFIDEVDDSSTVETEDWFDETEDLFDEAEDEGRAAHANSTMLWQDEVLRHS